MQAWADYLDGLKAGADVRKRKKRSREIAAKHGARNVRVFGSVARGEARLDSDVDLLDEFVVTSSGPCESLLFVTSSTRQLRIDYPQHPESSSCGTIQLWRRRIWAISCHLKRIYCPLLEARARDAVKGVTNSCARMFSACGAP
jgi:predicted nucleotidyltransferase